MCYSKNTKGATAHKGVDLIKVLKNHPYFGSMYGGCFFYVYLNADKSHA